MTDSDIAVILSRLTSQDEALREIKDDVKETKAEVKRTNGRVTELEKVRAVNEAVVRDHDKGREWRKNALIALVTAAVTGGIGSVVAVVAGGHI